MAVGPEFLILVFLGVVVAAILGAGVLFGVVMTKRRSAAGEAPVARASGFAIAPPAAAATPRLEVFESAPALAERLRSVTGPRVVNHWATWCEPCVAELPYLAQVAARERAVRFLGVSWDRFTDDPPIGEVTSRIERASLRAAASYPTLVAPAEPAAFFAAFALESQLIPQTQVIAANGDVIWSHVGEIDSPELRQDFERAVARAAHA